MSNQMSWDKLLCPDRRYPSSRKRSFADDRSEFERDYHRIIQSASFRRLQDKTQVYPLDKSDFIRTRLTHSLEVSSIAKSLGQSVGNRLVKNNCMDIDQAQAIADVLLCAGLLHDIGNPPFGHFGETVIRDWFKKNLDTLEFKGQKVSDILTEQQIQDLLHFEGNAQSLRVISKLHFLVGDSGMNLTNTLMNTIIKYPIPSTGIDKKAGDIRLKKMGYFSADEDIFRIVTESTGALSYRHPLVFLLEAADDIAYSTADLEDGVKKGILSYYKLLHLLENNKYRHLEGEPIYQNCEKAIVRLKELLENGEKYNVPDPELYAVQNWIVGIHGMLISSVTDSFLDHYDSIMNGEYKEDIFAGTKSEILIRLLKEIAFRHVFNSSEIVKLEIAADRILGFHMDSFVRAALYYDTDVAMSEVDEKLMQLISPNYKRVYNLAAKEKSEEEKLYHRLLLATDFVAGMTDHYAKDLYQQLSGIY